MARRRVMLCCLSGVAVFAIALVMFWLHRRSQLDGYRRLIESRFSQELSLIEKRAVDLDESDSGLDSRLRIESELASALAAPEIVHAMWAHDDHPHAPRTLKQLPDGHLPESHPIFNVTSSNEDGRHTLHFAGFNGMRVLRYNGWIPNGTKKYYSIWFRLDLIDQHPGRTPKLNHVENNSVEK